MNEISAIVVTYNSASRIKNSLGSISNQGRKDIEVIVVDNNSEDGTKELVKNTYSNVRLIENIKNYGYSYALNRGIEKASGRYIFCLNDDIVLEDKFIEKMVEAITQGPEIGAVQPKVFQYDGETIDSAGIYLSFLRRFHDIGHGRKDSERFSRQREVFGACAAAVLYRRKALESIKIENEYFDEDFFCIAEDVDLSWRLRNKGWKTIYCPEATCVHTGGISRRKYKFNRYLSLRNRYLMILKNESLFGFLRYPIIFIAYDLWRTTYMLAVNPFYFFKATYEAIKLSPKFIQKRWLI